jgi:hypothetical protein
VARIRPPVDLRPMGAIAVPSRVQAVLANQRSLAVMLFVVAVALRLIVSAVFYFGSVISGHHGIVDPYDPIAIDHWAWYAAQQFRSGHWVDLRTSALAGSWDVGFTYLVAFEYTVVGHHEGVARVTDGLLAAFSAPAVYLAARRTSVGDTVAKRAGWLVAVWPLSLYWSGYDVLKDPLVWFFLALLLLALTSRSWPARTLVGAISTAGAYLVRSYMGPMVAFVLVAGSILRRDWRGLLATLVALVALELVLVGIGFPRASSIASYTTSTTKSSETQPVASTTDVGRPGTVIRRFVVGVPVEALGPRFAVKDVRNPTLDTGMYPGLLIWIALIPITGLGFWRAAKRRDPELWSIAVLALVIWATLAVLYEGQAFRQREMAFPATLVFTSLGLQRPWPRYWWWACGLLAAVGLAALVAREAGAIPRLIF